jgi:hypothetical protein
MDGRSKLGFIPIPAMEWRIRKGKGVGRMRVFGRTDWHTWEEKRRPGKACRR